MSISLARRWDARNLAVAAALTPIPAFSSVITVSAAVDCRTAVTGDALAEVVVGESGNNVGAGEVHVFYGHRSGLVSTKTGSARNDQGSTQNSPGVPRSDDASDSFGAAVALGDFDRAGSITVRYGSTAGLTTTGDRKFDFGRLGHSFRGLGTKLAVADLNGDGVDDFAATANGQIVVLNYFGAGLS